VPCPLSETRRLAARRSLEALAGVPGVAHVARQAESQEMQWLTENSHDLEMYRGEWLLIRGQELIAHSPNFGEIKAVIRERNIVSPFVYYVPTVEEANFVSI
jgi:hypothetical protein